MNLYRMAQTRESDRAAPVLPVVRPAALVEPVLSAVDRLSFVQPSSTKR